MRTFKLDGHPHVLHFRGQVGHGKTQRVRTELVDHVQGVDAVALRLGHRLAVAVQDLRMDEHLVERDVADVVQTRQNHAGDPERDNVAAGDQDAGRIVVLQFRRLLRPAERGMWPERGTEPSVQYILFARVPKLLETGFGFPVSFVDANVQPCVNRILVRWVKLRVDLDLARQRACRDVGVFFQFIRETIVLRLVLARFGPDGNLVAPPKLTTDRPIAFLGQPVNVALRVARWNDLDSAVGHCIHRRLGKLVHFHEPLIGQVRFDRRLAAIRMGQVDHPIFDFANKTLSLQVGDDLLSRLHDRHALVLARIAIQSAVRL